MKAVWKGLLSALLAFGILGLGVWIGRATASKGDDREKAVLPAATVTAETMPMAKAQQPTLSPSEAPPWAAGTCPGGYGPGMMSWGYGGYGMMEPGGYGMMGQGEGMAPGYGMMGGMMGGTPAAPLTVDEARAAVEDFLFFSFSRRVLNGTAESYFSSGFPGDPDRGFGFGAGAGGVWPGLWGAARTLGLGEAVFLQR